MKAEILIRIQVMGESLEKFRKGWSRTARMFTVIPLLRRLSLHIHTLMSFLSYGKAFDVELGIVVQNHVKKIIFQIILWGTP